MKTNSVWLRRIAFLTITLLVITAPVTPQSQDKKKDNSLKTSIVKLADTGLQFEVPAGWRTQPQKDATQVNSPDGSVSVVITVAPNDNTELFISNLKDYLKRNYQNYKAAAELQKEQVNGLRALIENGSGETSEGLMEWNIAVLIGGKRPVIAFTVADKKGFTSSQSDYVKLVQSIKKAG